MKKLIIIFLFAFLVSFSVTSVNATQDSIDDEFRLIMQEQAYKLKKFTEKKEQIKYIDYFDDAYGGVFLKEKSFILT
jgi:hypothetical protein